MSVTSSAELYDEMFDGGGVCRPQYEAVYRRLEGDGRALAPARPRAFAAATAATTAAVTRTGG